LAKKAKHGSSWANAPPGSRATRPDLGWHPPKLNLPWPRVLLGGYPMGGKGAALRHRQGDFSGLPPGDPAHCCIFGHIRHNWPGATRGTTVGGRAAIKTNVRIIAATNKDLGGLIRQGLFREDLFFRLNVVPLRLPPLREHLEDIGDLAQHFFVLAAAEGLPLKRIEPDALDRLKRYCWPGNIRELENLTRRLAALYPQEVVTAHLVDMELSVDAPGTGPRYLAALGPEKRRSGEPEPRPTLAGALERHLSELFQAHGAGLPPPGLYHRVLREIEYPLISAALDATRGNQLKAAELLGLNRNTLRKKVRDLDIRWMRAPR
jgi:two-component system nitrogen regulation response regulator GlnG